jgi:hypothetical protein
VAAALAESLDKPFPWAVGFFFGNTELSLELWNAIAGGGVGVRRLMGQPRRERITAIILVRRKRYRHGLINLGYTG